MYSGRHGDYRPGIGGWFAAGGFRQCGFSCHGGLRKQRFGRGYVIPPSDGYLPDDDPLWISLKKSHLSDGVYSDEISCRGKGGSPTLLHLQSEPVRDESGQITHRIAVFRDDTERANLEDLIRRNERLACIGLLAAGIAHEINNPAGSALLAAETALAIKDSPDAGDRVTACLQNIVTSMDRCGRIVRTLLRYSRQEPSEKQACSINDVVEQAMDLARPYGSSHGADLRLDLDPAIPLVPMNPLEIELVLVNLIRNAIEAGGGNVVVSVGTMRDRKRRARGGARQRLRHERGAARPRLRSVVHHPPASGRLGAGHEHRSWHRSRTPGADGGAESGRQGHDRDYRFAGCGGLSRTQWQTGAGQLWLES